MTKKETGLSTQLSDKTAEMLANSFPVEASFNRVLLPRLSMASQDVTEGKGKAMKVVTEAGTFFTEKQTDEKDENGKNLWEKIEVGTELEIIIFFRRKQLKFFDGEKYTSSPVYDTDDQVIPLFRDKQEVDRGTPPELKSRKEYQGLSAKGKPVSKLEENRVLYVLYEGEIYQMNLRGMSMYAFMTYAKANNPSTVLTSIASEAKKNGAIAWNQMTFKVSRPLNEKEGQEILGHIKEVVEGIKQEKQFYAQATPQTDIQKRIQKENDEFDGK